MAVRQTDPDVEVLVESIRARLLRAHDRAGALRYVHFVLDGWNGEALPPPESYRRRIDNDPRGHTARGRNQQRTPGEVSAADVEPTAWARLRNAIRSNDPARPRKARNQQEG